MFCKGKKIRATLLKIACAYILGVWTPKAKPTLSWAFFYCKCLPKKMWNHIWNDPEYRILATCDLWGEFTAPNQTSKKLADHCMFHVSVENKIKCEIHIFLSCGWGADWITFKCVAALRMLPAHMQFCMCQETWSRVWCLI